MSLECSKLVQSLDTYNGRMEIFGWILGGEFTVLAEEDQRDEN